MEHEEEDKRFEEELLSFRTRLVEEQRKDPKPRKIITALESESADVHGEHEALPEESPQDSRPSAEAQDAEAQDIADPEHPPTPPVATDSTKHVQKRTRPSKRLRLRWRDAPVAVLALPDGESDPTVEREKLSEEAF